MKGLKLQILICIAVISSLFGLPTSEILAQEALAQSAGEQVHVPWHQPSSNDRPPTVASQPPQYVVNLEPSLHSSHFNGRHYDYNAMMRVNLQMSGVGFHLGFANFNHLQSRGWEGPLVFVGGSINPLGGWQLGIFDNALPSTANLYLLSPRLSGHLSASIRNSGVGASLAFSPLGLRATWCGPVCTVVDLRLLELSGWFVWSDEALNDEVLLSHSLGNSLSIGIAF